MKLKKIFLIALSLLILTMGFSEVVAVPPPQSRNFESVDELINWIETTESVNFAGLINLARQRDSIITVDEVSGEFVLEYIRIQQNYDAMIYVFANEGNRISIFVYLRGVDRTNRPLSEIMPDYAERVNVAMQTTSLESVQYIEYNSGITQRKPLENTTFYYGLSGSWQRGFFEIEGTHIAIWPPTRTMDGEVRTVWDNSYLDLFSFTTRPIIVGGSVPPNGANDLPDEISVLLNGERLEFDVAPIIVENRTLVPFRAIFEALGMEVDWDNQTRTAIGSNEDVTIEIPIDSYSAYVNGEPIDLDVPALLHNERTLVPIRFVAENSGANVEWDGESRTVVIFTD